MSVSLEIVPCADSLNMYGEPDRSTAYSLSGHVSITLSPSSYYLSRSRSARVLLHSIGLVFEGHSEIVTRDTGYASCRLFDTSQELLREPVELTLDDYDAPSTWNVVFNLTVPGWLPASTLDVMDLEKSASSTKYALFARAEFSSIDEGSGSGLTWLSSLSSLCFPVFSRMRVTAAPICDITINRSISQEEDLLSDAVPPVINHIINTVFAEPPPQEHLDRPRIPMEVLSKLRFCVAVPEYLDIGDSALEVALRMRTEGMPREHCERLRFTAFILDVEQTEKYRISPSSLYKTRFPLPPRCFQPPHRPLLNPHPMQALFELGLSAHQPLSPSFSRQFSLLPTTPHGMYTIEGDGYAFRTDADAARNSTWFALRTDVPISAAPAPDNAYEPARRLRASATGPLLAVAHKLRVTLVCTYDLPGGELAVERLHFHVPLRFACVQRAPATGGSPALAISPASSTDSVDTAALLLAERFPVPGGSLPYAPTLPAYSQLFDTNGDRKIDYSVPLPAYTPPSPKKGDVELCSFDPSDA